MFECAQDFTKANVWLTKEVSFETLSIAADADQVIRKGKQ